VIANLLSRVIRRMHLMPMPVSTKKLGQVRKEIGPDAVISRAIITEIEESCGGKI